MTILKRIANKISRSLNTYDFVHHVVCNGKPMILGNISVVNLNVSVGKNFCAYPGVYIFGNGRIKFGDNCVIGKDTIIDSHINGGIEIGNDVQIAGQCYIIDSDHSTEKNQLMISSPLNSKPIIIEDDVWIAAGVKVLKGVTLHKGCVCAAGAVVNCDIPEYEIWGGVPAKRIGKRK